jgi:hypothetical protein
MPRRLPTKDFTLADGRTVKFLTTVRDEIPYIEFVEYREKFAPRAGSYAARTVGVLWKDRLKFVNAVTEDAEWKIGTSVGGVVTNLSRKVPEQHPDRDNLYVESVEMVEGLGIPPKDTTDLARALSSLVEYGTVSVADPETNMVSFNIVKYVLNYTPRDYAVLKDSDVVNNGLGELNRNCIRNYDFSLSSLSITGAPFKYVAATPEARIQIPEPPPLNFPEIGYRIKWLAVPILDTSTIGDISGKINASLFESTDPGTMLFLSPQTNRYALPNGRLVYDMEFAWQWRPRTHYKLYRASVNDFVEVTNNGVAEPNLLVPGRHILDGADMGRLFKLPAS